MLVVMRNVLVEVGVSVSIQVGVGVGWHVNDAVVLGSDPGGKHSVTKFFCIPILSFWIDGDSEHQMPRVLLRGLDPFEPTAEGVFIWEAVSISSNNFHLSLSLSTNEILGVFNDGFDVPFIPFRLGNWFSGSDSCI